MSTVRYLRPKRFAGEVPIRWIGALLVALVGFVSYCSRTQVNPVTGETQRVALTPSQEIALGLRTAPTMAAQMGGTVPKSDPRARFVAEVGQRVLTRSEAQKSPYQFDFHLLADSRTINAFALPGGQIFITLGLLNRLENEAQLAGVLGHEIGHVIHRHAAEHMAKAQLSQSLALAVGVGATDEQGRGQAAGAIAQVAAHLLQLKYGRDDELESDSSGLRYMAQAGYDPSAMVGVMRVLASAGGGSKQPEFLVTHPYPERRIEAIKAHLAKEYPNGVPPNLTSGRALR